MLKTLETITHDFQPGDLFIDIGGNIGWWTIELFGLYDQIFFVEPSKAAIATAKQNIDTHCDYFKVPELKSKVTYFQNLCSDVVGETKSITSPTEDTGNFSVYSENLYGKEYVLLSEDNIETITIDSLIPMVKNDAKVLIKIDTEGADLDILIGGFGFIKKYKPLIMIELHFHMYFDQAKYDRIMSFLKNLGYTAERTWFACYVENPEQVFDLVHNGNQMKDLHYQMILTPPTV